MGLYKTSNFSIFTFMNASGLKFCTCSYSSSVYLRFKGLNGKICKMMMSHFRTPYMKKITNKNLWCHKSSLILGLYLLWEA